MADAGIKKIRVRQKDLPTINVNEEGYVLKYRIVSEDKNRTSQWSPISIIQPNYTYVPGTIAFNKAGDIASIVWDAVEVTNVVGDNTYSITKTHEYDIWVRWDRGGGNGDWLYKERLDTTSVSIPVPNTWTINGVVQGTSPNRMSVEIYLSGEPIERGDGAVGTPFLKVYVLTNETV